MDEDKKEYVVREGRTFGVAKLPAGTTVLLTEQEAGAFPDLVELRVKPRKGGDQNTDTRDTAKGSENIGDKSADAGTIRDKAPGKK